MTGVQGRRVLEAQDPLADGRQGGVLVAGPGRARGPVKCRTAACGSADRLGGGAGEQQGDIVPGAWGEAG
jgi:hypothetical protein